MEVAGMADPKSVHFVWTGRHGWSQVCTLCVNWPAWLIPSLYTLCELAGMADPKSVHFVWTGRHGWSQVCTLCVNWPAWLIPSLYTLCELAGMADPKSVHFVWTGRHGWSQVCTLCVNCFNKRNFGCLPYDASCNQLYCLIPNVFFSKLWYNFCRFVFAFVLLLLLFCCFCLFRFIFFCCCCFVFSKAYYKCLLELGVVIIAWTELVWRSLVTQTVTISHQLTAVVSGDLRGHYRHVLTRERLTSHLCWPSKIQRQIFDRSLIDVAAVTDPLVSPLCLNYLTEYTHLSLADQVDRLGVGGICFAAPSMPLWSRRLVEPMG